MFEIFALNPPGGERAARRRKGRSKGATRRKNMPRKSPPRYTSGPKKGQFKPKSAVKAARTKAARKSGAKAKGRGTSERAALAKRLRARRRRAAGKRAMGGKSHYDIYGFGGGEHKAIYGYNSPRRKRRANKGRSRRRNPTGKPFSGRKSKWNKKPVYRPRIPVHRSRSGKNRLGVKSRRQTALLKRLAGIKSNPRRFRSKHRKSNPKRRVRATWFNGSRRRRRSNPGRHAGSSGGGIFKNFLANLKLLATPDNAMTVGSGILGFGLAFGVPTAVAKASGKTMIVDGFGGVLSSGVTTALMTALALLTKKPKLVAGVFTGGGIATGIRLLIALAPKQAAVYLPVASTSTQAQLVADNLRAQESAIQFGGGGGAGIFDSMKRLLPGGAPVAKTGGSDYVQMDDYVQMGDLTMEEIVRGERGPGGMDDYVQYGNDISNASLMASAEQFS